jgi:hypothetical protein
VSFAQLPTLVEAETDEFVAALERLDARCELWFEIAAGDIMPDVEASTLLELLIPITQETVALTAAVGDANKAIRQVMRDAGRMNASLRAPVGLSRVTDQVVPMLRPITDATVALKALAARVQAIDVRYSSYLRPAHDPAHQP